MCFLFGFACGYVGRTLSYDQQKEKCAVIKADPMHQSSVSVYAPIFDALETEETSVLNKANYASQICIYRDMYTATSLETTSVNTFSPEVDIGLYQPFDTS